MKRAYKCYIVRERSLSGAYNFVVREKNSDKKLDFVSEEFGITGELQRFLKKNIKLVVSY